jgi:hypothetical protein
MSDVWGAQSGQDPGMWARLMGYVNPVSPAAADTLRQGSNPLNNPSPVDPRLIGGGPPVPASLMSQNPLNNPSPVDPRLIGGGPPVPTDLDYARQRALRDAQAQLAAGSPPNSNTPATLGPVSPIQKAAQIPTSGVPPMPPQGAPQVASPGRIGIGSDANFPVAGASGFPGTYAAPGQQPPVPTPATPMPPVRPKGSSQPVVRKRPTVIPASATASVPAARSPWITGQAQNQDVVRGGALARGGGGRPMGMLDLSRLFARQ